MKSRAHRYRYVRHVAMSCFPDGRSAAPPTLSYATPQSWTYGVAISTLSPTTTGATSFAVQSGALPTGVSLNAGNGNITGTPTTAKVAANVVIRATGPGGTADATINIAVPSPLYTSLVDYWNLDEASGNRAGSHAGLTLTDNNTVTSAAGVGGVGTAALLTASNSESLTRADESALRMGDNSFMVAGWVYGVSLPTFAVISGKGTEWYVNVNGTPAAFFYETASVTHGSTLSTGTWYFVVAGWNKGTGKNFIRVNNGAPVEVANAVAPTGGVKDFGFGVYTESPSLYWDGRLQAFGLWKGRILTDAEQTWLWNAGAAARTYDTLAAYDGG